MIQVVPAILENSKEEFTKVLKRLSFFNAIDIDISREPFAVNTLPINEVLPNLIPYSDKINFGFHIMALDPQVEMNLLRLSSFALKPIRFYLHQESDLSFLKDFSTPSGWRRGVVLKPETNLVNLEFYNDFNEVQFMTVKIGSQGGNFLPQALVKIRELREIGFKGEISVDGGVNLESASQIKLFNVDRVSVGSFLTRSKNPEGDLEKLTKILNY